MIGQNTRTTPIGSRYGRGRVAIRPALRNRESEAACFPTALASLLSSIACLDHPSKSVEKWEARIYYREFSGKSIREISDLPLWSEIGRRPEGHGPGRLKPAMDAPQAAYERLAAQRRDGDRAKDQRVGPAYEAGNTAGAELAR